MRPIGERLGIFDQCFASLLKNWNPMRSIDAFDSLNPATPVSYASPEFDHAAA